MRCAPTGGAPRRGGAEGAPPGGRDYLSMEEWGALPGHGMANFHGDKIWLILGLIRERMTDEQFRTLVYLLPPPSTADRLREQAFEDSSPVVVVEVTNHVGAVDTGRGAGGHTTL